MVPCDGLISLPVTVATNSLIVEKDIYGVVVTEKIERLESTALRPLYRKPEPVNTVTVLRIRQYGTPRQHGRFPVRIICRRLQAVSNYKFNCSYFQQLLTTLGETARTRQHQQDCRQHQSQKMYTLQRGLRIMGVPESHCIWFCINNN